MPADKREKMGNWATKTAVEQLAALKTREVSAVELLELTIARSQKIAKRINPFALELYDRAREAAVEADIQLGKSQGGTLCGLPITVKDSQWLAGVPCANGSPTLANFIPTETCTSIRQLEAAGAVIFAKTTCPEFCLSGTTYSPLYGHTLNPWNTNKTPGGSSGGAAAAIAAGAGSLSFGSDGGGSIRIPSAFCGIVGFKPSYGTVIRQPGFGTWDSLVAYGPMCRSVADARLMFSVVVNPDLELHQPAATSFENMKFVVSEDLGFAPVNQDIRSVFKTVINRIITAGAKTVEDNPALSSSVVTWATIATNDMWQYKGNTQSEKFSDPGNISTYAQEFIKFGSTFSVKDIKDAETHADTIHECYLKMFKRHQTNILITPTLGCEAFSKSQKFPYKIDNNRITYPWLDWAGFLYDANLTGMPSCSIPMGLGKEGLPISLQIIGAPGHDLEVLDVAEQIEKLIGWGNQIAPDFNHDEI